MILITGPLYSGKHNALKDIVEAKGKTLKEVAVLDKVADMAEVCESPARLQFLADTIAAEYDVVLITETGGGVVPLEKNEREKREKTGRLSVLLGSRAEEVYRVFCGIPTRLK